MVARDPSDPPMNRRTVLRAVGATAGVMTLGTAIAAGEVNDEEPFNDFDEPEEECVPRSEAGRMTPEEDICEDDRSRSRDDGHRTDGMSQTRRRRSR